MFTSMVNFSLILSTVTTSFIGLLNVKVRDKYIQRLKYVSPLPKKTNLIKNKFYLLFSGLKNTYVTNKLKSPFDILDH